MISKIYWIALLSIVLSACTSIPKDPLQNTKKLVKEGHRDLYENGAFQVPSTTIKLIPPGPGTVELAGEFVGLRARQSFLLSLKNAQSAVYLIADGTKTTYSISKDTYDLGNELAQSITKLSRPTSKILVYRSTADAYGIAGASFDLSKKAKEGLISFSRDLENFAGEGFSRLNKETRESSSRINKDGASYAHQVGVEGLKRSSDRLRQGGQKFVTGYIELPDKWRSYPSAQSNQHFSRMNDKISETNKWQTESSAKMANLVKDSGQSYFANIGESLHQAKQDLADDDSKYGKSFAALKASRWVLQALFYDALLAPLSKAAYGSVGYIFVNGIAYPVMLAKDGGVAVTNSAVQYTWDGLQMAGDIVAPTLEAAFAGVISGADLIGTGLLATGSYVGSKAAAAVVSVSGHSSAALVGGASYVASKGVYYIGVPLTTAGVVVGGSAVGAVYGASEAAIGSAVYVGGEVAQISSRAAGAGVAGGVLVVGAAASTAAGSGLAVFEVAKSVAVPTGFYVGSGIALGYTSSSQLAAQSLLAVSDAAYLVLSLEGPKWVIYAVSGKTGDGGNINPGTVLNLNQMKKQGEEFYKVPATEEEVQKVIEALPKDLKNQN